MSDHDELILEKIAGLKEDIGEIKTDVKEIKQSCACRLRNCNIEFNKKISFKSFLTTLTLFIVVVSIIVAL